MRYQNNGLFGLRQPGKLSMSICLRVGLFTLYSLITLSCVLFALAPFAWNKPADEPFAELASSSFPTRTRYTRTWSKPHVCVSLITPPNNLYNGFSRSSTRCLPAFRDANCSYQMSTCRSTGYHSLFFDRKHWEYGSAWRSGNEECALVKGVQIASQVQEDRTLSNRRLNLCFLLQRTVIMITGRTQNARSTR